jgi:hypothetical protein
LPEMRCVEVVCDADVLDAATPGAAESGDPVRGEVVLGDAVSLVALAAGVTTGFAPVPEELGVLLASVLSVWLMSMSCSRLFTLTSWLMYSFGSVSAVGSWFCISVTSSVRKSLAEIVAEPLLESLELLVLLVPDVGLAMGIAVLRVSTCPAVIC